MFCVKCGAQVPEESAFCNKCGVSQSTAPETSPPPPPAPPPREGPEEIIWTGRYSAKAAGHWWVIWFLWLMALSYIRLGLLHPSENHVSIYNYAFLILAGAPALVILWHVVIQKLSIRYRLSTHRLFKETGIISRQANELELIRVDDVSVRQNLIQRIFNVGVVTIISTDATDPRLDLDGIDNPIEVKERIRGYMRERRARTLHMESL